MHIECTGQGPDLVLLHGWAMHGGIFSPLVEQLRERWTLHVVDLPGHGRSREDATPFTLDAIVSALVERVPTAPWLGWSLGGLIAQRAALSRPDRVPALIAIASSPRFVRAEDWPDAVDPQIIRQFGAELAGDWRATVERFLALEVIGSAHAREDLRGLREQLFAHGDPAPRVLSEGLRVLEDSDLRSDLPKLQVPSLWIAGRRDRLVPWPSVQAAAERAPGGRYLGLAGAGHAPFLHHAPQIADALASLMAEGSA